MSRVFKLSAWFIFGFLLPFVFVTPVFAQQVSTGYSLDGVCYSSSLKALEGFQRGYPAVRDGYATTLTSSSVAGNVLSYTINSRDFSTGTSSDLTGSVMLSSCQSVTGSMSDNTTGLLFASLLSFFTAFFCAKRFASFYTSPGDSPAIFRIWAPVQMCGVGMGPSPLVLNLH